MNQRDYETQCQVMLRRAQAWKESNRGRDFKIQWNFPKTVFLIGSISDAITSRYVTPDATGLELIKALGPWGVPDEPTIAQVRAVIEIAFQ